MYYYYHHQDDDNDDGSILIFWTVSITSDWKPNNISENGPVSIFRWNGEGNHTVVGPLEKVSLYHWTSDWDWVFLANEYRQCSKILSQLLQWTIIRNLPS